MQEKLDSQSIRQNTFAQSLILTLVPGLLIFSVLWLFSFLFQSDVFLKHITIFIPTLIVVIPIELGYLLHLGKKLNGRFSLKGVVSYLNHLSIKDILMWVSLLTIWNFLIFYLFAPMEMWLIQTVFAWMPSGLLPSPLPLSDLMALSDQYSKGLIVLVLSIGLILNGLITPIVEEFYFRGYILPRQAYLKQWAPVVNVALFAMYHLFSPWKWLTITVALLPAVYLAWKKKAIGLTILTHCLLNTLGIASSIIYILTLP